MNNNPNRGGRGGFSNFRGNGGGRGFNRSRGNELNNPGGMRERAFAETNPSSGYSNAGNLPESKHLTGPENYANWSFLMKALLMSERTWGAVTGTDRNQEANDRAYSKLCLNVSGDVANLLYGLNTAKEVWDKLHSTYSDSGLVMRCALLRSLFQSTLDRFGSITEYVNHMIGIQQRLVAMDCGLEDQFLAIVMLSGLPKEYEPIVMTFENSIASLTSAKVRARLQQHDLHNTDSSDINSGAIACFSKTRPQYQHKPNGSSQIVCFNCNRPGHKKPGCPELRKKKGKGRKAHAHVAEEREEPKPQPQPQHASLAVAVSMSQQDSEELV